jgi:hypothetical protein
LRRLPFSSLPSTPSPPPFSQAFPLRHPIYRSALRRRNPDEGDL